MQFAYHAARWDQKGLESLENIGMGLFWLCYEQWEEWLKVSGRGRET